MRSEMHLNVMYENWVDAGSDWVPTCPSFYPFTFTISGRYCCCYCSYMVCSGVSRIIVLIVLALIATGRGRNEKRCR